MTQNKCSSAKKTIAEKGARGNIYDCNGAILASNHLVYTLTMADDGVYESNRERQLALNSIIYRLREQLHQNGDQLYNEFKIMLNADGEYAYTVDGAALQRFKADIFGKRSPDEMSEEQSAMGASEMIQYLSASDQFALYGTGEEGYTADELAQCGLPERFAEELSKEAILDIVGIRYLLSLHSYRQYQTVTIARDISPRTMAYVLENKASFPGIEVEEDWERVYEGGEAFAHIFGYIGSISSEELETLKQENASDLEREVAQKMVEKKESVQEQLLAELTDTPHAYEALSEEMKEYAAFVVQDSGLISQEVIDEADFAWGKDKNISLKDFLYKCLRNGWIQHFLESQSAEKILLKYMLYNGGLPERDFCRLLYEQEILAPDDDYEAFLRGELRPFALIRKKIDNVELAPAQLALDPCSASAVVVQVDTGKILACVTYPGYDNNRLADKIDSEYYNRLLQDRSLPLYNRATQQLTAPGSTLKPVTVIAGLQEGVIAPNTSVVCDGVFDKVSPSLRCWRHSGHGTIGNAAAAIQHSCNDYLCDISYRLGQQETGVYDDGQALAHLQKYAVLFDLDKKSGAEIVESSPHVTEKYGIPSAIGQGTHNYTTVQLARYMSTLANRGTSFRLSMVEGIGDKDGNVILREPIIESTVDLDEQTWDTVWQGMRLFAQNNSVLKDMKINVAGKTGTAQESRTRPDHSLFIGCAPAEKPEIAIAVRIANGYGSSNATHAGKDIFDYYFGLEGREAILTGKASEANNSRSD